MIRRSRTFALLIALAASASACSFNGLSFRQDTRFSWHTPRSGEELQLPLRLEWEMRDYDGSFAVFFDRAPMRPGRTIDALVPDGDPCDREPGCPDAEWLEEREIFITSEPSLYVEQLPDRSGRRSDRDPHEVTVVLLDDAGRRSSETSFVRDFTIDRSE